jgi:hypothetical protein
LSFDTHPVQLTRPNRSPTFLQTTYHTYKKTIRKEKSTARSCQCLRLRTHSLSPPPSPSKSPASSPTTKTCSSLPTSASCALGCRPSCASVGGSSRSGLLRL